MMRQPRIKSVSAAEMPLHVVVNWLDGKSSTVDLTALVREIEMLAPLEDPGFFGRVGVGEWGWSLEWPDEIELGSDTLWRLALEQQGEAMRSSAFREWRERNKLSLADVARALGLSRRTVIYYEQGRKIIPKTVLLATKGYDAEKDNPDAIHIAHELWNEIATVAATANLRESEWISRVLREKVASEKYVAMVMANYGAGLSGTIVHAGVLTISGGTTMGPGTVATVLGSGEVVGTAISGGTVGVGLAGRGGGVAVPTRRNLFVAQPVNLATLGIQEAAGRLDMAGTNVSSATAAFVMSEIDDAVARVRLAALAVHSQTRKKTAFAGEIF